MAEAAEIQGTTTAAARRWPRRMAALLAVLPVLATALLVPLSAPAAAAPAGSRTAQVSINRITPAVPREGDTVTLTGTLTNKGRSVITDARVALHQGPLLAGRSAIHHAADREGFSYDTDGWEVSGEHSVEIKRLQPGISHYYTLKVPMKQLDLSADGAYQLGVVLTGQTKEEPYPQVLGIGRTVLTWQPPLADRNTKLTFLWPLVSSSHLTARTDADEQQTPIFHNDELLAELAPGGRLQQLVALGKDLPVTWVIDPDLLATADAMTKPYRMINEDGNTVQGQGQQYARKWLNELQGAVQDAEVMALPFADPDLASLAHRGKNVSGALSHLGPATELAETTVETVLGVRPSTDFAWPVEGAIDSSIVSVATSAGARYVITRSDSLRENGALDYTPSAPRPIGGGTTAVVADARLSNMFHGDLSKASRSSLAVQRFLAQAMAITSQAPDKQRSIVVAPQRRPTVSQAQTMAEALETLRDRTGWVEFADLTEAATSAPDPGANRTVPGRGSYPKSLRSKELSTNAFEQLEETQDTLDGFTVILTRDDRVVAPVGNAILREMSTSWRGKTQQAAAYRGSVQSYLIDLTRKVRLIEKSPITLSGRSATIPVTVQNNLVQAVDGLELRLTSSRRIGLEVGEPQPVRVAGGHSQSVRFTTTAKANGRAYLEAQLYTKDGRPYGAPMTFQANVTEITSTVLLVIAGGVLLVVLAGIRMYTQRKRAGVPADPDAPLAPEAGEEEGEEQTKQEERQEEEQQDGDGERQEPSGQPSDRGTDMGSRSGGRSASGEKVER